MTLDKQTVHDIARLARLSIDDTEVEKYRAELSNILDLVTQMEACDTTNTEPMTHPFDATLKLRADKSPKKITVTNFKPSRRVLETDCI